MLGEHSVNSCRRFSSAGSIIQSGISSVPISSRNGRLICGHLRRCDGRVLLIHPCLRDADGQFTDAGDDADALGDADRAAGSRAG